ncbi:MAG: hypothetical protein QOE79_239 [Sphingomonadales bacterium]|jgi:hypothetical protein|nr:hypothetical protein [Sphingomonadales bacterium]
MLEALEMRAAALAERRVRHSVSALAAALREEAPRGVRVEEKADGVVLIGRGLMRQWLTDPALRWIAERTRG